jgi:hypothetical protein
MGTAFCICTRQIDRGEAKCLVPSWVLGYSFAVVDSDGPVASMRQPANGN